MASWLMAVPCLRALRRWGRNEQLVGSAAWDLFVIVGYYAIGIFVLDRFEGWSATDTIYFLSVTVTTIGYGDISPTTNAGQVACCALIVVGIVVVLSTLAKYATVFQAAVKAVTKALMRLVGHEMVNVSDLPIDGFSPTTVNRIINYPRAYAVALIPLVVVFVLFMTKMKFLLAITTVEAFYFAVVTCTTVGYGDFSPAKDRDKLVCSVFLVICVVVLSNTITELFDIRLKRRIRSGKSCQPDVEQLLLAKIAHHGADPSTVACYESDYVVAALVESGVVDAELLRAIRRQYHWTAIGADGDHEDIDLADLHHKLVNDQRKAPSKRSPNALPTDFDAAAAAARGALAFTKVADAKGPVPEDFDDWFRDVWMPKVDAARAARQHLREEGEHAAAHYHVHSEDRHRHDAAADDGP